MPTALARFAAVLLLVLQVLMALAPGRALRMQLPHDVQHALGTTVACGHGDSAACDAMGGRVGDVDDELCGRSEAQHPETGCRCHVHVPVPGAPHAPNPPRLDQPDHRSPFSPRGIPMVLGWSVHPVQGVWNRGHPPDFTGCDQFLGLRATRLLI